MGLASRPNESGKNQILVRREIFMFYRDSRVEEKLIWLCREKLLNCFTEIMRYLRHASNSQLKVVGDAGGEFRSSWAYLLPRRVLSNLSYT